ncbi:transposase [Haloferula chungangensis]|uniref:Transposase n=1 Tax=Haloferula chungangensis TaxID=1048331 RepID=A0ABW2LA09_9BACT
MAYFHCVSRVVGREYLLGPAEKEHFIKLMRIYEALCGLRIASYCLMSNHFHLLVEVPQRPSPDELPNDENLVGLVRKTLGKKSANELEWELGHLKSIGNIKGADALRERWFARMWDISSFMKTLKQRFTQWFNARHKRKGTLWEDRFRSVLVQGECHALRAMAAYIDLNPVRAGICEDPADYRWCNYAEALAGGQLARQAVSFLNSLAPHGGLLPANQRPRTHKEGLQRWRCWLFGLPESEAGQAEQLDREKTRAGSATIRDRVPRKAALDVLAKGGRLDRATYLRCRIRYFTDGLVIGHRDFVEQAFAACRDHFSQGRKKAARPMRGLELAPKPERLYAARQLQKDVIT